MDKRRGFPVAEVLHASDWLGRRTWALGAAVAALLCACAPAANEAQTDRELLGLSGEVQQVISRTWYPQSRPGDMALASYTVTVFDKRGQLLEEKYYNAENALTGYRSLTHDRAGRAVEEEIWTAGGELTSRAGYSYDRRGRLRTETYYDPDGTRSGGYSYEYDSEGRLARRLMEATYEDGSERSNEVAYQYDTDGRLIEETYREEALGGTALRVVHTYRGDRRAYSSDYQRGRWLEFRVFYSYDDAGNVLQEVAFQIPEGEDSALYEPLTTAESFPQRLLSSRIMNEHRYFQGQ